jgi:hypothetical protein
VTISMQTREALRRSFELGVRHAEGGPSFGDARSGQEYAETLRGAPRDARSRKHRRAYLVGVMRGSAPSIRAEARRLIAAGDSLETALRLARAR